MISPATHYVNMFIIMCYMGVSWIHETITKRTLPSVHSVDGSSVGAHSAEVSQTPWWYLHVTGTSASTQHDSWILREEASPHPHLIFHQNPKGLPSCIFQIYLLSSYVRRTLQRSPEIPWYFLTSSLSLLFQVTLHPTRLPVTFPGIILTRSFHSDSRLNLKITTSHIITL